MGGPPAQEHWYDDGNARQWDVLLALGLAAFVAGVVVLGVALASRRWSPPLAVLGLQAILLALAAVWMLDLPDVKASDLVAPALVLVCGLGFVRTVSRPRRGSRP